MPWSDNYRRIWKIQVYLLCLSNSSAFSALTLLVGWQEGHLACKNEWWGAGMVICLERGADLHMAQLMPLPLTVSCFSKTQTGFPFWYRLTRFNVCVCVLLCLRNWRKNMQTRPALCRRHPGWLAAVTWNPDAVAWGTLQPGEHVHQAACRCVACAGRRPTADQQTGYDRPPSTASRLVTAQLRQPPPGFYVAPRHTASHSRTCQQTQLLRDTA